MRGTHIDQIKGDVLRQVGLGFFCICSSLALASPAVAETLWSNASWRVEKGNPEADDDSVFLCNLSSGGRLPGFRIVAYESTTEASFEISIQDDSLGPTGSRHFPLRVIFDGSSIHNVNGTYVQEFASLGGQLPHMEFFLNDFARSAAMTVESSATGKFLVPLNGSRAAVNAFQQCLGLEAPFGKRLVNSEIYYGSRAGMVATVTDEIGLDTASAEIRITHTRENAKAFCEGYVLDPSEKCISETMEEVKFPSDRIYGNCKTGEFVNMWNGRYRFEGKNHDPNVMADFRLRSLKDDTILDGSSASGYGTAMGVLSALCPTRAKAEGWREPL